jgi:phospholipase C
MIASNVTMPLAQANQRFDGKNHTTTTPIEHVIVVIGENRSFDHVFATYKPKARESIANMRSKGIVNGDGSPWINFPLAAQFTVAAQSSYYISTQSKVPYATLPPPDTGDTSTVPQDFFPPFNSLAVAALEKDLALADLPLLTTGASGLPKQSVDTRVTNAKALLNGPFQLTGPTMPYDAYTGDTTHRFFQMWQQSDCSRLNATRANPTGCLSDLYPFVNLTFSTNDNGGGNPMAFLNISRGDTPFLKQLADEYTISDNFHQSVMGGTAVNHIMLGHGDLLFFSDGKGNAVTPPAGVVIANPNPKPNTNNNYTADGNWSRCDDNFQPGVGPIVNYLDSLPYRPDSACAPGHFYMINNINPAYLPNGKLRTIGSFVPPSNLRSIGDALIERNISWAYYGGAFRAAVNLANGSTSLLDAIGQAYCEICNPFQYSQSIFGDVTKRAEHMKDTADLFSAITDGTLPAVSFAKPDGLLDGHPETSKLNLFEAYLKNILDKLDANPKLKAKTAVFVTFDETGGYWDSGFIQPLDFFGDGPRIPMIVVSPFSKGGKIVHSYTDHVSILKFIERNWRLQPLSERSRDNLPNPKPRHDNAYVPANMPAIGDLFDMFDFDDEHEGQEHHDRREGSER